MRKVGYSSAIRETVDRLFVYGTLRAGQTARSMIADHVGRSAGARTTGTLVAFPDYPGMLDGGAGEVVGEIVWLTDLAAAFALLDAYEGEDFVRILTRCRMADGAEEWAWCYVLADARLAGVGTPIPHGDWARWRAEQVLSS